MKRFLKVAAFGALLTLGPANCRAQGCQPYWAAPTRPVGSLVDFAAFDAGDGVAIYASGFQTVATNYTPDPIRRWDGYNWVPVGTGLAAQVGEYSFKIFDEGTGPHIYFTGAGPNQETIIRRWNGAQWVKTTQGLYQYPYPNAHPEFYVPEGPAVGLYGVLKDSSNSPPYVVYWQRGQWTRIGIAEVAPGEGGGIGGFRPMTVFDSGGGP